MAITIISIRMTFRYAILVICMFIIIDCNMHIEKGEPHSICLSLLPSAVDTQKYIHWQETTYIECILSISHLGKTFFLSIHQLLRVNTYR